MILRRAKIQIMISGLLVFLAAGHGSPGWGYEEADIFDGGTVLGRVTLKGKPPPARIYHLIFSPNIDYCIRISDGKGNRLLREFEVAEDGGLKNAVVAVVGVERGKPFNFTPQIEIEDCRILPIVTPVRNRHPIHLVNRDPITHDIQAYTVKNPKESYTFQMFNKPMPSKTVTRKEVRFRKGHYIFRTQCGVHDFMQSWGMAVGNPYFTLTGPDGLFTIPDLPPGEYDIIAWHPRMQVQAQKISVQPNGRVNLNFEFDPNQVETPMHDLQMGYRLETWLQPSHLVPPAVELQVP